MRRPKAVLDQAQQEDEQGSEDRQRSPRRHGSSATLQRRHATSLPPKPKATPPDSPGRRQWEKEEAERLERERQVRERESKLSSKEAVLRASSARVIEGARKATHEILVARQEAQQINDAEHHVQQLHAEASASQASAAMQEVAVQATMDSANSQYLTAAQGLQQQRQQLETERQQLGVQRVEMESQLASKSEKTRLITHVCGVTAKLLAKRLERQVHTSNGSIGTCIIWSPRSRQHMGEP